MSDAHTTEHPEHFSHHVRRYLYVFYALIFGTVVTVGTTDWSHGLNSNDLVVPRVTKNVLDRLGK